MSARTIILALFAIIMAGGTAFYARTLILKERQANLVQASMEDEVIIPDAMMVLVAKDSLNTGSFISEESLEWIAWPEDKVAESYVTAYREDLDNDEVDQDLRLTFNGSVVKLPLPAGQPVTKDYLVQPGERGFLAAVLEPGNRAISVPISETSGIAGFAFPGDRVDMMLTLRLKGEDIEGKGATRFVSLTLAENVRILAIGQSVVNEEGDPHVAKTATVEVSQKQAEKVALGLEMGELSLSLRGLQEQTASVNKESENALEAFLKSGAKENKDNRNFTMDIEVFTVNGQDLSLKQHRVGEPQKSAPPSVTVLRGGAAGKG